MKEEEGHFHGVDHGGGKEGREGSRRYFEVKRSGQKGFTGYLRNVGIKSWAGRELVGQERRGFGQERKGTEFTGQELFQITVKKPNPSFQQNGLHTMATAMATRMADTGPSTMEIEVRMLFFKENFYHR